ncbi:MAG: SAM-dependent methyltransferase [Candidatus Omnitrophota bacterium]
MILTRKELDYIISHKKEHVCNIKVDFGLDQACVKIEEDKVFFENGCVLDLNEEIKENFCYDLDKQGLHKVAFFAEDTNRFYKLTPTADWPTFSVGSVPMHKLRSPRLDTQQKIDFLRPYGLVLDTCTGLGYTAIASASRAEKVITFERDENVITLAGVNPCSRQLFLLSNIERKIQDVTEGIKTFPDEYFNCIIHDPPTFKLSPELYSPAFYAQLLRVLKRAGKLFHYTPLYKIRQGVDFPLRIKQKLIKTGFKALEYSLEKGGILCRK